MAMTGFSQLSEVPLSTKINSAIDIVEGEVISQFSFWDDNNQNIYTSNKVQVFKKLKGENVHHHLEVITLGGAVGMDKQTVQPSLQFEVGDKGVFFLKQNLVAINTTMFQTNFQAQPYSGPQGFIKYDPIKGIAHAPFRIYEDPEHDILEPISIQAHTAPVSLVAYDFSAERAEWASRGGAVISNFSPTTSTAGTASTITINGAGFGASAGTVRFSNADDGGATFTDGLATEIVSWNDTQIVVEVSQDAGTGPIEVVGTSTATSATDLTVSYAQLNAVFDPGTGDEAYQTRHVDRNANGGYIWQMHTDFDASAANAAFIRSLDSWRCSSGIYWEIGSTTTTDVVANDNINIVRFDNGTELPNGVLGRCTSRWSGCGGATIEWYVEELDIVFDDGTNWNFTTSAPGFTEFDFETVSVHELGHGHQMGHVIDTNDVMHYAVSNGEEQRTPNANNLACAGDVQSRSTGGAVCGQTVMSTFACAVAPVAEFSAASTAICNGGSTTFSDLSTNAPTSWTWGVSPGTFAFTGGTNANSQNPEIQFNAEGLYDITLTATNGAGSDSETKTSYINVGDTTSPVAVCQNITVFLDGAGNASIVAADIDAGSSDNCGSVSLSATPTMFTCAELGINTVTLTATDGNSNSSTCTSTVTVIDSTTPTAIFQNITTYLDGSGNSTITAADVDGGSSDNCGTPSLSTSPNAFTCADIGTNSVTLTATDGSGNASNASGTVTVIDSTSPTAFCQNITVFLSALGNATITAADVDGGSSDNCGSVSLSASPLSFTCADLGSNTVTMTTTDGSGNTDMCTSTVTVLDSVSPTITCPGTVVENVPGGTLSAVVNFSTPTANDNCGSASVVCVPASGSVFPLGTTTVVCTATDGSSNEETCSFSVIVQEAGAVDDCGDATALTPVIFGVPGWQSFALGASESLTGCTGDADDDVWFSFAAQSPNDVVLAQDPAGGYNAVVEIFDACGGTSLGCFDNYGAGAIERALPGGLVVGQTYFFRVYDIASGASASTDVRVQVKTFDEAEVHSNYCAGTYDLSESIYSERDDLGQIYTNPGVNVNGYRFLFEEQGGGLVVNYTSVGQTPYITLGNVPGLEYGKTYDVSVSHKVRIGANATVGNYWSDYGTSCPIDIQATVPTTQLRTAFCNGGDYYLTQQIRADAVPGASQYRFRFDGGGNTFIEPSNNYSVFLYNVGTAGNRMEYATVYSVDVDVFVNGAWSGYGPVCTIGMESGPEATAVRTTYCGGTYAFPAANYILAESVYGADYYQWRATPQAGGSSQTDITSGVSLAMHITSIDFSAGGDWDMEVRAFGGNVLGDYSSSCSITMNPTPIAPDGDEQADEIKSIHHSEMDLRIFPNPNDGDEFRISMDGLSENGKAEFFLRDLQGRLIESRTFVYKEKTDFVWNTTAILEAGVYLLETRVGHEQMTKLFTVR